MKALLDTNILIDYLKGMNEARDEIARYDQPLMSPISWMEVMVGTTPEDEPLVRGFLAQIQQVSIDASVGEEAVTIRREYGIRLPDAIIWASARVNDALLVSRNTRDFPQDAPGVRVPYVL
jgi:hypothetical protein